LDFNSRELAVLTFVSGRVGCGYDIGGVSNLDIQINKVYSCVQQNAKVSAQVKYIRAGYAYPRSYL